MARRFALGVPSLLGLLVLCVPAVEAVVIQGMVVDEPGQPFQPDVALLKLRPEFYRGQRVVPPIACVCG